MTDEELQHRKRKEEIEGKGSSHPKRMVENAAPKIAVPSKYLLSLWMDTWSDEDDEDPELEKEYSRQFAESDGFDVNVSIWGGLLLHSCRKYDYPRHVGYYGRLGLHCYNIQNGTNLQLMGVDKYNTDMLSLGSYYITLEAMDPADGSSLTFQTLVRNYTIQDNEHLRLETEVCRLKGASCKMDSKWEDAAVDDFYKGKMPDWPSDDALADKEQYYEVQESDLRENDWLHLYSVFGFYSKWSVCRELTHIEIKKIVVQTRGSHLKLKDKDALFYIIFKANDYPFDYRAIIRRTMDGKPGHLNLQVQCWDSASS